MPLWKNLKATIDMYIYGASGHSKVIIDILRDCGIDIEGIFDDNNNISSLDEIAVKHHWNGEVPIIIAIGNNNTRKRIANKLNCDFGKAVHPSVTLSASAHIEAGTVVMPGAIVNANAFVGAHSIVNTGAIIEHECHIEDFVHLSPGSILCGNVRIGEGTWIGAGATIIQGIKIGKWAVVGAGAVVIRDVPDNAVVAGVPAKVIRYNCDNKLDSDAEVGI